MINPFFKNKGPFKIDKLLKYLGLKSIKNFKNIDIHDIKDLFSSTSKDITFFHSKKYSLLASKTKASFCITTSKLKDYLPKNCEKIIVDNVLVATAKITKVFYPESVTDDFDKTVKNISKTSYKKTVDYYYHYLIAW